MKKKAFILVFFCAVALLASAQKSSKLYLLSVGVSKYSPRSVASNLYLPAADADTVASIFAGKDCEYIVLKDSDATADNIKNTARKLFAQAEKQDVIMMFFSGHGIGSGFCAHDYNYFGGSVTFDDIKSLFRMSKSYGKILIADACFSGNIRINKELPDSVAKALKKKSQVMLFLSSRGNETSLESPSMSNGYFTTYLAKGLRGEADYNKNGNVTAVEISKYVSTNLQNVNNGHQHSNMWGNFNNGWIIKRLPKKEDPKPEP